MEITSESMVSVPNPYSMANAERGRKQWLELAERQDNKPLAEWMRICAADPLLDAVFGNSPYLTQLLMLYPQTAHHFYTTDAEKTLAAIHADLLATDDIDELMRLLRVNKGKLALLTALADIGGFWSLEHVTAALSDFAERSLCLAVDAILRGGHKRGEIILPHPATPSKESGVIVLGMGKLGGRELNYSSDIDLIIFYEPGILRYKGRQTEQHFMNRLAHDLVDIMQDRTRYGYVFRTDLRLRPDPASTPPAVTTEAAVYYYESVGQNWERAAMIKARPVAGDYDAGTNFLKTIAPFMWRRSLDFASINDIHSIKRQMDSGSSKIIQIKGHNIKLGRGGIREIEFYAQIHQLIWGGREPALRTRATCDTLLKLVELGLVDADKETLLHEAYGYFRKVEHRLQMVADEQTHTLPTTNEGIAHIAAFMGYKTADAFAKDLISYLEAVHAIYASSFQSAGNLGDEGNLVFTGVSHDPETLQTLRAMGYSSPERISEIVMGWHHGSTRATRTKRARELLTEMMPTLLKRLSETADPDAAFLKFSEFLANLPAGVQLFSLFSMNPHLLGLIADIMGSAPTLAESLSKTPQLLDAVLYGDFYGPLPTSEHLARQCDDMLATAQDFESVMDTLRRFRNEKQFQAGVHMLRCMISAQQAGAFLSRLADLMLEKALAAVTEEFSRTYGTIAGSQFAIIALGKLGSQEMTFSSDIDLVFVYDVTDFDAVSDGEKSFSPSVYYNRLCQRFLNALSAMGREGRLYEVDTRLRPSGKQGLLAVSTKALTHYFDELAWTFEYMAFTKARVVCGEAELRETLDDFICDQISKPRDPDKLRHDASDMRDRIVKTHASDNPWDIKYVRGGLMDIDFIAQTLMLLHAPATPGAKPGSAAMAFDWLSHSGRLDANRAQELIEADRFLGQLFNMIRLCSSRTFDEKTAPEGLKKLLVESVKEADFAALKARLIQVEQLVYNQYIVILSASA